jgi:hypothetical protein
MSFMAKVKQWLGIGGVKIVLTVPEQITKDAGRVDGKLAVTTRSDQLLQSIEVKLVETWTTGRGEDKTSQEFDLGNVELPGFELKAGEAREVPFSFPFELLKSRNDRLKEKGGALGVLGKAGSLMDAEKSTFHVSVSGDVKGAAFGPTDVKEVRLV